MSLVCSLAFALVSESLWQCSLLRSEFLGKERELLYFSFSCFYLLGARSLRLKLLKPSLLAKLVEMNLRAQVL